MDPQLKGDQSSVSGESTSSVEADKEKKSPPLVYDESVFDAYQYRHRDIVSMIDISEADLEGQGPVLEEQNQEQDLVRTETQESDSAAKDSDALEGESEAGETSPEMMQSQTLTQSESQPINAGSERDDSERPTMISRPSFEATQAMLQRIQTLTNEAKNIKTSRHSREIINRNSIDRLSRVLIDGEPSQTGVDEDEWDMVEDAPEPDEGEANGKETLFSRGVVDKYRLAVLKRRESTIRRKPSTKFKRSPASSVILGGNGKQAEEIPPVPQTPKGMNLRSRFKGKMKTPKINQPSRISDGQEAQRLSPSKKSSGAGPATTSHLLVENGNRAFARSSTSVNSAGWSTENGSEGSAERTSREKVESIREQQK